MHATVTRRVFEVLKSPSANNGYGAEDALRGLIGLATTINRITKSAEGFTIVWELLNNDTYLHTFCHENVPGNSQSHQVSLIVLRVRVVHLFLNPVLIL